MVEETNRETIKRMKRGIREFPIKHISKTGLKVAKKKEREEIEIEPPEESSEPGDGYPIDMQQAEEVEDALDSEFERY